LHYWTYVPEKWRFLVTQKTCTQMFYSHFIDNSHTLETKYLSVSEYLKQILVCLYHRILFSNTNRLLIHPSWIQLKEILLSGKKITNLKWVSTLWFYFYKLVKWHSYRDQRIDSRLPEVRYVGGWMRVVVIINNSKKESLWWWYSYLIVMATWSYTHTKTE
jgi:hypothetical protein